jgi:hypothetical protein
VLLTARVRQSGSIVIKAWAQDDVSQFYATRSMTETKRVIGARACVVQIKHCGQVWSNFAARGAVRALLL